MLKSQSDLPWICGDDFNETMWTSEKKGAELRDQNLMMAFRDTVDYCDLVDIDYMRVNYTWSGIRAAGMRVWC